MSIRMMSLIWPMTIPSTDKMVFLALADAANDDGVTWIAVRSRHASKADLMKKTSLTDRTIQQAIRRLEEAGMLFRDERKGRGVIYRLTPEGASGLSFPTPEWVSGAPEGASGKPSTNHHSQKKDAVASSSSASAPKRAPKAKMNTVPDGWEPNAKHIEKVAAFGWPDGMMEEQAERFREWEFRDAKTDFDLAFHRWLRTENDRLKGRGNDHGTRPAGSGPASRRGPSPREDRLGAMQRGAMAALDRRR